MIKRVSPLLGSKRSDGFKRRVREGIQHAQLEGKPFGRQRERPVLAAICEICNGQFTWTKGSSKHDGIRIQKTGRFCSKGCLVKWLHRHRKRLPDSRTLTSLYVQYELTTPQIAKIFGLKQPRSVGQALEKIGVKRRRSGPYNSGFCVESGCNDPVYLIKHKTNGSTYGRRCFKHWKEHRGRLYQNYRSRQST